MDMKGPQIRADGFLFETREAQEAADLMGIQSDLAHVATVSRSIVAMGEANHDEVRLALIDSAIIRYRRCFAQGVRLKLPADVVSKAAGNYKVVHKYFYDLGNKHVAHSVNVLEQAVAVVHLDKSDPFAPRLVGQAVMHVVGTDNPENFARLAELADTLNSNYVEPEINRLLSIFEKQAEALTPDEMRKLKPAMLPVNPEADQIVANRWRAKT